MGASTDSIRVLHVDPEFADSAAATLEGTDDRFAVEAASSAEAALDLLAGEPFDCVVTEYDLLDSSGVNLLESVRERDSTLPVVMFTGDGSEAVASAAISAGVTDYVRKGEDEFAALATRIVDAVERRRDVQNDSTGEPARSERSPFSQQPPAFLETLVETVGVGVAAYDANGEFVYVNERFAENLGTDRATLLETQVWEITADLDRERFESYWASFEAGETRTAETVHALDGRAVPVETVTTRADIGGATYHFGTARDITDRKEQEQRYQAFVEQSNDILTVLDGSSTFQYQSPSVRRVLGYEPSERIGDQAFEYVHPDDRERVTTKFGRMIEDGEQDLVVEYRFRHADGSWRWLESRGLSQPTNSAVDGHVINSRDVTERRVHERQIGELHDATREMVQASSEHAVSEIVVETAENVLDHPISGVWLANERGDRLESVALTDSGAALFDDIPVYTEGNSLSWRAYATGETQVVDDLREESGLYNPDTVVGSELIVPLGEYGVLNVGSREPHAFSDNDITLAKLLGANAQAALGRSEREQQLERQADQMEFFNSILRHDVLNAVTVIRARAQFLQDELEGEQLQDAETIIRWSNDVEQIVQRVRTVLETLTGEGDPELEPIDLDAELRAEIERVSATYSAVTFDTEIPQSTTVLANDLLGDVLGNVVTNAIEHNDTEGLRVDVTVQREDDDFVVRIADNGQGVPNDRKEAIFRRGETGHAKSVGSGFGLFFADVMVTEYGGEIAVEDTDGGGATFLVRLPAMLANDPA